MLVKTLKKNKVLLIILLLITIITIILIKNSEKPSLIQNEVKQLNTASEAKPKMEVEVAPEVKKKVELKKENTDTLKNVNKNEAIEIPILNKEIDFIGRSEPLIYSKPQSDISKIMEEHEKINTIGQEKYLTEKEENWEIDYAVGLEEGAIEALQMDGTLKPEMINGKVGFSTSF